MSSLYGCSKSEAPDVRPVIATRPVTGAQKDTTGTAAWLRFLARVEAGTVTDPLGQYVRKGTFVASDGQNARPTRPKDDATKRWLASLPGQPNSGTNTSNLMDDRLEVPNDEGGGGVPYYSHFSSTEMVQPYDTPPTLTGPGTDMKAANTTTSHRPTAFYTTENPNGYLYDLKIVKGPNPNRTGFNDSPYYHNIEIDLNEGAGGEYIYVSFTRDPSKVQYQTHSAGCGYNGSGGDETPRDANGNRVDLPVTYIDTEVRCCNAPWNNCHGVFTPMYAPLSPSLNSNGMKLPDLNNGAGGSHIYSWLTRVPTSVNRPIELGVLAGNSVSITPPSGWIRVGSDLNNGAGGSYIFFCIKYR